MAIKNIFSFVPGYCHYYFDLIGTDDLISELKKTKDRTLAVLDLITTENENSSYQSNKWTTKEVIRHIIDCERIYSYRAFRFSRFDDTGLSGFNEGMYIENSKSSTPILSALREEYLHVRDSSISLYNNMTEEMLDFKGKVDQNIFSARALGFMTIGHNIHHCDFLCQNYLNRKPHTK